MQIFKYTRHYVLSMIIKNRSELETTELRKKALDIIESGIDSVLPKNLMKILKFDSSSRKFYVGENCYDCSKGRIFVIGAGKASGKMALEIESVIGTENIECGIVSCKSEYQTKKIKVLKGGHPIPDRHSIKNAKEILRLKRKYKINENDTLVCLISGGGSSLLEYPMENIKLKDLRLITKRLIESGATINEVNIVRKHLSMVKGGRLANFFSPARMISLIISDVNNNDPSVIASGMTSVDNSTFDDAHQIIGKYGLIDEIPGRVIRAIIKGVQGKIGDTAKRLKNCHNHIIGTYKTALVAMGEKAESLGFNVLVDDLMQIGDAAELATARANEIIKNDYGSKNAIIISSEATVKLPKDHGIGGRNMHYALVSAVAMKRYPGRFVCASIGSDGTDFIDAAAGAIIDEETIDELKSSILSAIERYDSYTILKKNRKNIIITGPTGTNVCDFIVYLLD